MYFRNFKELHRCSKTFQGITVGLDVRQKIAEISRVFQGVSEAFQLLFSRGFRRFQKHSIGLRGVAGSFKGVPELVL